MEIRAALPDWVERIAVPGTVYDTDEARMELAIALAWENVRQGGGPFGAAVYHAGSGRLVAAGVNLVLQANLSVFHAEVTALSAAQTRLGSYTLNIDGGHVLVTSSEPCAMCLGAILWSGVRRVVFGASCDQARAVGFDEGPVFPQSWDYLRQAGIAIEGGLLADKAGEPLAEFVRRGGTVYNG